MARVLNNIKTFVSGDPEGNPEHVLITYDVIDGSAVKKGCTHEVEDVASKIDKTLFSTGDTGEFWRDEIDLIKTAESIS